MFAWLFGEKSQSAGLRRMRTEFGQMIDAGRHIFDTAANAFLGSTDPDVIRKNLFETDKRINKAERKIRRELVVHTSVHGAKDFPACLVLMSIVKDAERVGDYSKNLFDLAELSPKTPKGKHRDCLIDLKDRITLLMSGCREVFDSNNNEEATRLIGQTKYIEDVCDENVRALLAGDGSDQMAPAYVLAYRYFKRVASHTRNVISSVVQPVHKIDFTSKIEAESEINAPPEEE